MALLIIHSFISFGFLFSFIIATVHIIHFMNDFDLQLVIIYLIAHFNWSFKIKYRFYMLHPKFQFYYFISQNQFLFIWNRLVHGLQYQNRDLNYHNHY